MKKLYTLAFALLASATVWAQRSVTFQVDMSGQTVNANGVHIAGSFQQAAGAAGNWDPSATSLTQVGTSSIYEVTVNIPDGNYEFKFLNGNAWGDDEGVPAASQVSLGLGYGGGNSNRYTQISSDTTLPAILFGGNAPANHSALAMVLDMSLESSVDSIISVAGSFQGWSPGATTLFDMFGDSLYRYTAYIPTGDTVAFKYINGSAWGDDESVPGACAVNGNRQLIMASDTVFGPTCFAQCGPCFIPDTFNITIQVDMSAVCGFDPATDQVDIGGPFNGWPGSFDAAHELTDANNDMIYEISLRVTENFTYKARWHATGTNWEGGANNDLVLSSDSVIPVRCFGNATSGACAPKPDPSDITFQVDMSNGPASFVKVFLIGDFTDPAWQGGAIELTPSATLPGVFETTVADVCPGKIAYKFMIEDGQNNQIEEDFSAVTDSSCLEPSGTGNFNRFYVRPDDQPKTLSAPWEMCSTIGLSDFDGPQFEVYPNPFSGSTQIVLPEGSFDIRVLNVTGQEVARMLDRSGRVEWNAQGLPLGLYFIEVGDGQQAPSVQKVLMH